MSGYTLIRQLEADQLKSNIPTFRIGDTLDVHTRIVEGGKERVQVFTGTLIARAGSGLSDTITLYRVSYGTGVERLFPIHSPRVVKIEVARLGKVRKAKLYHIRGKFGKASRVQGRLGGPKAAVAVQKIDAPAEDQGEPAT